MSSAILDGLSLVDTAGHLILAAIVLTLVLAIATSLALRARYAALTAELERGPSLRPTFSHPVLARIASEARAAYTHAPSREPNLQAIVDDAIQAELRPLLLAERFVRAATGLVIILGLLGTFYGLTLSIGKLVHLVASDTTRVTDVGAALTSGLTEALSGMAVAFSNSLLGVASAVVLTVVGVFTNVTDRRVAFMVRVEAWVERAIAEEEGGAAAKAGGPREAGLERVVAAFGASVERLEGAVARFDGALSAFATSTRDFKELNLHLKDNVQRMSLGFADFSDALKSEVASLKSNHRGG